MPRSKPRRPVRFPKVKLSIERADVIDCLRWLDEYEPDSIRRTTLPDGLRWRLYKSFDKALRGKK